MSRIARVVVPEVPHHITQRGNRRLQTFFCDEDYEAYIDLMCQWCTRLGIEVWAYCLMSDHIHLIAVPPSGKALSLAIGEAHRRYTRRVNLQEGWRGLLWQGCFASFPMDKTHLYSFIARLENVLGRILHKQKPGPKRSQKKNKNLQN